MDKKPLIKYGFVRSKTAVCGGVPLLRWRMEARRFFNNLKLDVTMPWAIGDRLPGFVFNFQGHRPVSTWEWFSSSEMSGGQYRAGTEWGNGEIGVLVFDHTACDIVT